MKANGVSPHVAGSFRNDLSAAKQSFSRSRSAVLLGRVLLLAVLLGSWELVSGSLVDGYWISKPSLIASRLHQWAVSGFLATHIQATLTATLLGFGFGAVTGILLGFLLGSSRFVADVLQPFIIGFYAIPKVALVPLFILWLGVGMPSIVALVALTVLFPVFYNTFAGIRSIDHELVDSVRIMGASRLAVFTKVVVPAAREWIFAGLKIAVRYALTTAIYGELVGGNRGIGYLLEYSSGRFDTTGIMAAILLLAALGLLLVWTVMRSEFTSGGRKA